MRLVGEVKEATVTQSQLGRAIGVSKQRINQLIDEGIVVRDELSTNGQVMLFDSLQNYFLSKNTTGDGVSFWKERSLHEKVKRELDEVKLSRARGELYDASTVELMLVEIVTNFKNRLLGIPSKFATQLEGKPRDEIYTMLTTALEDELTELSEGVWSCDFDENFDAVEDDNKSGDKTD
jgi:hypothetical protein